MRIAITTATDRAPAVSDLIAAAGHTPVELPCIAVTPVDADTAANARQGCLSADLIVITSSRAVAALWPDGGMPDTSCAVVGERTAAAVEAAGGTIAATGDGGADQLVDLLESRLSGLTVALPQSSAADPSLAQLLTASAAAVAAMTAYRVEPQAPGGTAVDAVLFASPTAVEGWRLSRSLDNLLVGAIGPTTAASLGAAGHPPDVVAPQPSYPALLAALTKHERIPT